MIRKGSTKLASAFLKACSSLVPIHLENGYKHKTLSTPGRHSFFGYHDITPFDEGATRVLACRVDADGTPRTHQLEVGYYDLSTGAYHRIGKSEAWCWQQTCRLQWHPNLNDIVLYNSVVNKRYRSIVHDIEHGKVVAELEHPIYSISPDSKYAISLNFSRLQRLRPGYGYDVLPDATKGELAPATDGLRLITIENGEDRLLLSLREIAAWEPTPDMLHAEHYFNHILWNPSSTAFMFFHLWTSPSGKRSGRALIWRNSDQKFYPLAVEGHVSHHAWVNDSELLIYSTHQNSGTFFHKYNIESGKVSVIGEGQILEDYHLMVSPRNPNILVLDGYPDRKFSRRHLLTFDMGTQKLEKVASFFSPKRLRGEIRCDLHARWSRDGQKICIDTAHDSIRKMVIVEHNGPAWKSGMEGEQNG